MDKDCSEIQELLSGYLDHILSDEEEFEVEVHLAHCESCRDELHALMKISDTLSELKPVKAPDDFLEAVKSKIAASQIVETKEEVVEDDNLNTMQGVSIPSIVNKASDKKEIPVKEEKFDETKTDEERIEPQVMTPEQMTAETHIDVKPNYTKLYIENLISNISMAFKRRNVQAGFGLFLASICLMLFIKNIGMNKPEAMTAKPDVELLEYQEEEKDEVVTNDDFYVVETVTDTTVDTLSYDNTSYIEPEDDVWEPFVSSYPESSSDLEVTEPVVTEKTPSVDIVSRSFSSVLDEMSSPRPIAAYENTSVDVPSLSYSDSYSYSPSRASTELDSIATADLSDIEKEVLKSALSRADDELRSEYGYRDYYSEDSLQGITAEEDEIANPMSISIANDRNMVYISADDPVYIVNMLRDKSEELYLDEPIINASELPYVVSYYVTGAIMERLLDECRAAGIRDMYMSFEFESYDYDQTALYYLQIDR